MQRIPQRFVQQESQVRERLVLFGVNVFEQARGVTVTAFLETQRRMVNRFESGF